MVNQAELAEPVVLELLKTHARELGGVGYPSPSLLKTYKDLKTLNR